MPSGRLYGPEKSSSTIRELCAGKRVCTAVSMVSPDGAEGVGFRGGSPGGWSAPESTGAEATGTEG
eukprot:4446752-Pleurochrysis_carterae.AAC.1